MFKKKFSIIIILSILILALTLPIVRADDEITNNNAENQLITSLNDADSSGIVQNEQSQNIADAEANLKKGDVYLTGENITIDYIVDGNLFIMANSVTINSQIGGDAFILAKSVTVGEQGYIFSNLFVAAETVEIKGVVYDLYSACENVTISGYLYRDIHVATNTLNIFGIVGRNAFVNCATINFANGNSSATEDEQTTVTSNGRIGGNLDYSSKEEIVIPEGNVNGNINFTKITSDSTSENKIGTYLLSLATFTVTVVLIWLVGLWIAPKFIKFCDQLLTKKPLQVIGIGLLTPFAFLIAFVLLLIIKITSSFAILLLPIIFTLMGISSSIVVIAINNLICNKLKIEKLFVQMGFLIISAIATWLICLIPLIGGLISLACVIIGTGLIVSSLVLKKLP